MMPSSDNFGNEWVREPFDEEVNSFHLSRVKKSIASSRASKGGTQIVEGMHINDGYMTHIHHIRTGEGEH